VLKKAELELLEKLLELIERGFKIVREQSHLQGRFAEKNKKDN